VAEIRAVQGRRDLAQPGRSRDLKAKIRTDHMNEEKKINANNS
jgi:hypothetical protein